MGRRFALVVTLVYMLAAGTWIVVSDTLLSKLGLSAERISSLSLVKGIGFVLVTSAVLYFASSHVDREYSAVSERLSDVFDVSPVPIITLDLDGNVTMWNSAAERVFGWTEKEVLGKPNPIVPDELRAQSDSFRARIAAGESLAGLELSRVTKDGRTLLIRLFTAAIHDERGAITGWMGIMEDITERRAARLELERHRDHLEEIIDERTLELRRANDALRNATEAKDTFLASMSHELRTPLNSIIGFSGIMLHGMAGPLNEEQNKQLGMVNAAGHHLLALINDVLDLVKIEAGQTAPALENVRVGDVLKSVAGIMRPLAEEKRLELSTSAPDDTTVVTDRRRIEQILLNLVSNAIKFTAEGSVSVVASSDMDHVRFEVTDTGAGVPVEALESIFDEFTQIERSERVRPEGTGLGLAISRRLATLLGGRISARSEIGVGSVFTLEIPLRAPAPESPPPEADIGQCSVLVVDDDVHARAVVSLVLRAAGYRVTEASDGERALSIVSEDRPDCIVLDLVMPGVDGWSMLTRLKEDPVTTDIPVICTSVIDAEESGVSGHCAGYLVKPIDTDSLVEMLDAILSGVSCSISPESEEVT